MYSPALNGTPVTFASRYSSRGVSGFLREEAVSPCQPPKIAARRIVLAVALARVGAVDQEPVAPDDAHAASPATGGRGLRSQLVLVAAHREAQVELLDRVVAGVGHQVVDRVHRVLAVPAPYAPSLTSR